APHLGTDAVVDGEQSIRVVALLHLQQARVVRTPERTLPVLQEIVAFGNVRAGVGNDLVERAHRVRASLGILARGGDVRFVTWNARKGRRLDVAGDCERERIQYLRVGRGVLRGGNFFFPCAGQALVEMEAQTVVAGESEQCIDQVLAAV